MFQGCCWAVQGPAPTRERWGSSNGEWFSGIRGEASKDAYVKHGTFVFETGSLAGFPVFWLWFPRIRLKCARSSCLSALGFGLSHVLGKTFWKTPACTQKAGRTFALKPFI